MATQTSHYHRELPSPPPAQYQPVHHQQQPSQVSYGQSSQLSYEQSAQTPRQQNTQPNPLTTAQHQRQYSYTQQKPPSKARTFSFHSDKSHKSSNSKSDIYHETSAQKEAKRLHSKADPTLAMNEAEPAEIAAMTQTSLAPLRSIQHRDALGNPIADPDKSNPTRSRWERPLDTIRSFEAAIDGGYSRKSMIRADTDSVANWNRRSSYHPGIQSRYPESNYGSRPVSFRPDQTQYEYGGPSARNSYYDGHGQVHNTGPAGPHGYSYGPGRHRNRRMNSEPIHQHQPRDQNVYHLPHKDRSYETVTSAAGSGASDQLGYQTDPTSSDNSSIERNSPARKPVNDYGIGFSQPQAYPAPNFTVSARGNGQHPFPPTPGGPPHSGMPPAVARKEVPGVLRRQPTAQNQTPAPEKRKSWFARRFSKS